MVDRAATRDGLGCTSHSLAMDMEICRNDVRVYRKAIISSDVSEVLLPASDRGFLVGVSVSQRHRRRIYRGGPRATTISGKDRSIFEISPMITVRK